MDDTLRLRAEWAKTLDRFGGAGRAWRKSLVLRACDAVTETAALAADPAVLKAEVKAMRRARAQGHWSFQPERLRFLLAFYLRARAARRRGA